LSGLLGLAGFEIDQVEQEADGSFSVHVSTAGVLECCPDCGTVSTGLKETVGHTVRHLVVAPLRVTWRKQRLTCGNAGCERESFVERTPLAVPGGRVSVAALAVMGHLIGDWLVPVSRAAAVLGVSWHTAHGGFVRVADEAGIVVTDLDTITSPGETAGAAAATDRSPRPAPTRTARTGILGWWPRGHHRTTRSTSQSPAATGRRGAEAA
jgi:hypothetical protein